jgi:hypothetical protein
LTEPKPAAAGRARARRLISPQAMAARQLPHLVWPKAGSGAPPPMLSFYWFCSCRVVEAPAGAE